MSASQVVPPGFHTVTPYLVLRDVPPVLEFLKATFGEEAEEIMRMPGPGGGVMHAEIRIGDSIVMMGQTPGETEPIPAMLYVYVADVDATFHRAVEAGAATEREPRDEFYGDRVAGVRDSQGNRWWFATRREDVPAAELEERARQAGRS